MEDGGQFGGWAPIAWFSKAAFFHKNYLDLSTDEMLINSWLCNQAEVWHRMIIFSFILCFSNNKLNFTFF